MPRRVLIASLIAALLYLPTLPSVAGTPNVTPEEQWFAYEVNRARSDPAGYAAAHGVYLSDPPSPKPPLAVNDDLFESSEVKSDAMAALGTAENHLCPYPGYGTTLCPNRLALDAGYPLVSWWDPDANQIEIFWGGGPGSLPQVMTFMQSPQHRGVLFEWDRVEIGVGVEQGQAGSWFAAHIARRDESDPRQTFITGVVFADANGDCVMDLYSPSPGQFTSEGMSGVTVSIPGTSVTTNAGGGYSIPVAPNATYQVTVSGAGFNPTATASAAVGTDNIGLDFIDGKSTAIAPGCVERWWGMNRYETAVDVSQATHPDGAAVVYLASGYNFPDALAAGPAAAAEDAPVLLASTTGIPEATRNELRRLNPSTVRILGGEAALAKGVVTQLANLLPGATIDRRWGPTRYETAAMISNRAFPSGADTVYIATGEDFPDAVAAAPAAIAAGGPLLLVMADRVPDAVATELGRLNSKRIYVLGSAGAVSNSVLDQLDGYASQGAVRISGASRYATAVAASEHAFPNGAPIVYIAVGTNYPDALTGGAATAVYRGPILLVTTTSIPAVVATELRRLDPDRIVILGGPAAVSTNVASQLAAFLPD